MAFGSSGTKGILRGLDNSSAALAKSFERLASGKRINRASDDAAGLAIADALAANVRVSDVASRNIQDGKSLIAITDSAQASIGNIFARQAELAQQASNGTLSDTQRQSLKQEFDALGQEAQRIASTTEFNGIKPLEGSQVSFQVGQSGTGSDNQISVEGSSASSLASSLSSLDIGSQAGARAALDSITAAIQTNASNRGIAGAVESRLDVADNNIKTLKENQAAAESRIRDADIADESAKSVAARIRQQVQPALLAQANVSAQAALKLLS